MSPHCFSACFQTVKFRKHSPWEKGKVPPMFFKMGWDHLWQGDCANVLVLYLTKLQPISDGNKWISFFGWSSC